MLSYTKQLAVRFAQYLPHAAALLVLFAPVLAHAIGVVAITSPSTTGFHDAGTLTSWDIAVTWGGAASCGYEFNSFADADIVPIDCSDSGSGIPAPAPGGGQSLRIKGSDGGGFSTGFIFFDYEPAVSGPSVSIGDSLLAGLYGPNTWNPSVGWDTAETCEYSYDDNTYYSAGCGSAGTDILPPSVDGPAVLYIRGSTGGASSATSVSFTYDSSAPNVLVESPNPGDTIHSSDWTNPTVAWDGASDCEYSYDGSTYYSTSCSESTDIPFPDTFGATTLYVKGTDGAGNVGTDSVSFDFLADVPGCTDPAALNYDPSANVEDFSCTYPDVTPPNVSITSPTTGVVTALSATINWDDATTCSYSYDAGDRVSITCGDDSSIAPPDTPGVHTLYIYGDDDSANEGEADVTFTYAPEPLFALDSGSVSSITTTGAIVHYSLTTQGSSQVQTINVVYDTDSAYTGSGGAYGSNALSSGAFADIGAMNIDTLSCGTTYHFAFVASNDSYTATSSDATFNTAPCAPHIAILAPQAGTIASTAAINWDSATTCEYSYGGLATSTASCAEGGTDIPGPGALGTTTLYVYGENSTASSEAHSTFLYSPTIPSTVTGDATDSTQTSASVGSAVYAIDADHDIIHIGLQAATDDYYVSNSGGYDGLQQVNGVWHIGGGWEFGLSGLICGTTYHYRVYGIDSSDTTGYGLDRTFTTSDCSGTASVSILAPADSASLNSWGPIIDWGDASLCEYNFDSGSWQTADCASGGSDIAQPSDGSHTLTIRGSDNGGGTWGSASAAFSISTAPLVSLSSPTDSGVVTTWAPSVDWDTSTSCEYSYTGADDDWHSLDCGGAGADIPQPSDGVMTLHIRGSTDGTEWGTAVATFTLDTTGPAVSLSGISVGATVYDGRFAPVVDWGDSVSCLFSYDGFVAIGAVDCSKAGADIGAPGFGATTLALQGYDSHGNITEVDRSFTYSPLTAPTITRGDFNSKTDSSATYSFSVDDPGSADVVEWGFDYAIDADYNTIGFTASSSGTGDWSTGFSGMITMTGLSCGATYDYRAYATNADGQTGYSDTGDFILTCPPAAPSITVGDSDVNQIELTWSGPDLYGGTLETYNVYYRASGAGEYQPVYHASSTDPSLVVTGLSPSTSYDFKVTAYTTEEGEGALSATATATTLDLDTTLPVVSIVSPLDGEATSSVVALAATSSDDRGVAGVTFYVNDVRVSGEDTTAPYTASWDSTSAPSGVQSVVAVARDTSDNYATSSPVSFTTRAFAGAGTVDAPYQIDSCGQLPLINNALDASYRLNQDLDCSGLGNDAIIGATSTPFTGTFDGHEHSLTLNIYSDSAAVGLFAATDGATIKDLNFTPDTSVLGITMVGAVVGSARNTTLLRVAAQGQIVSFNGDGTPGYVGTGGLVGLMDGGAIYGSSFYGLIAAPAVLGGIVGMAMDNARIEHSSAYTYGYTMFGYGGIAGYLFGGAQVRNSFAYVNAIAYAPFTDFVPVAGARGGLVGVLVDGTVSRSYALGSIDSSDNPLYPTGGLIGVGDSTSGLVAHSFSDVDLSAGAEGSMGGLIGGVFDGATTTLVNDYFDVGLSSRSTCLGTDTPIDGCTGVDAEGATNYWLDPSHGPLNTFDTTTVWTFDADTAPTLLPYTMSDPVESDGLDAIPSGHSEGDSGGSSGGTGGGGSYPPFYVSSGPLTTLPPPPIFPQPSTSIPLVTFPSPPHAGLFTRDLTQGMTGEDVRQLQIFLNAHDFTVAASGPGSSGHESITFGPATARALAAYQRAHGIAPAAGYLGAKTRAAMGGAAPVASAPIAPTQTAFSRDLTIGARGPDVVALQQFLSREGYSIGLGATGYFGAQTAAALAAYQRAHGIAPAAGYFGAKTRAALVAG